MGVRVKAGVENGAMLTTYLFRYASECTISWSEFENFLRLRRQGGIDPPDRNPADALAVVRSRLLARWPGTHSRIVSRIQRAAQTVLGVHVLARSILVHPAHWRFSAIMRDMNPRTHSLTRCRRVNSHRSTRRDGFVASGRTV